MRKTGSYILTLLFIATLLASCAKPVDTSHHDYIGKWRDDTDDTIVIRASGVSDCKQGNVTVTGGAVTFEGDSFSIGLGPIQETFKINQPPANDTMVVNDTTYHKVHYNSGDESGR